MTLDPKALEAAGHALDRHRPEDIKSAIETVITAYLAALPPVDVAELVGASNPLDHESVMKQWDSWREYIADGGEGSWPRDAFESLLDCYDEALTRLARDVELRREECEQYRSTIEAQDRAITNLGDVITRLARERDALRDALEFYASFETWWAVIIIADEPAGEITDDFDVDPNDPHSAERPGKRARASLSTTEADTRAETPESGTP